MEDTQKRVRYSPRYWRVQTPDSCQRILDCQGRQPSKVPSRHSPDAPNMRVVTSLWEVLDRYGLFLVEKVLGGVVCRCWRQIQ